ncbi:zonadhesin-like [Trichoplusia ni]|uniref:Zonadhesin-like n=1 Tax=Trichoplusia ni TaxID=7111 RepID=A0A7E5WT05_TRINI|nr:zonadhesin-like [Trichoplusia ni]
MSSFRIIIPPFVIFMFVQTISAHCGGDRHATYADCSDFCTNNCDASLLCTSDCQPGCSCKPGYIYDYVQMACVLEENCSDQQ